MSRRKRDTVLHATLTAYNYGCVKEHLLILDKQKAYLENCIRTGTEPKRSEMKWEKNISGEPWKLYQKRLELIASRN